MHGALLDTQLLADVYLELMGGRQPGLGLAAEAAQDTAPLQGQRAQREARAHTASAEEQAAHAAFIEGLKDPIWNK